MSARATERAERREVLCFIGRTVAKRAACPLKRKRARHGQYRRDMPCGDTCLFRYTRPVLNTPP